MNTWIIISVIMLSFILVLFINAIRSKGKVLLPEKTHYAKTRHIEYAKMLQKLIQCKTISKSETFCATEFEKLREVMQELFPLIHQKAEKITFGDDCWIYKIEGKDPNRNIMVMSHHDVVKADGEWKHAPFSGEIVEGKIWGRGTVDTKTPLFAEFMAIEELLNDDFVPPCNLYIGSSHNEEISGDGIPLALEYFKNNHIFFELIIDEGGAIIEAPLTGIKCKCAMIAIHEKGRHTLNCFASKETSHEGLVPLAETPIVRMAKFITEINSKNIFIRRFYPEVRAMFKSLSPYMAFPMRLVFANLWCFSYLLKILVPKLNAQAGAMLGTTCSFTGINGGKYDNVQSNVCKATGFLRCVNQDDLKKDIVAFKNIAEKYGIDVTDAETGNECYLPTNPSQSGYKYIQKCIHDIFPHVASAPFILPAGTDARHLTQISKCVIRFAPIELNPQQFASVHSENENIDIKAVGNAVAFYKNLIKNYQ